MSNYNIAKSNFYQDFENAENLITNEIAYELVAKVGFQFVHQKFSPSLNICDVGCYLGGSTARWWNYGQRFGDVRVLGTDIYPENVQIARQKYPNINFETMLSGGKIPLLHNQKYHLMFATFVLDTIKHFDDVANLCYQMVDALVPQGNLILLRLHPNALQSHTTFREYRFSSKSHWSNGDPLHIELVHNDGKKIDIYDTFWHPEKLTEIFRLLGCDVKLYSTHIDDENIGADLRELIVSKNLSLDMPEWNIPLYQIMNITHL